MTVYADLAFRLGVIAAEVGQQTCLDIGGYSSGHHGYWWNRLASGSRVTANRRSVKEERPDVWADGQNLPFNARSFPVACTTDVLEHMPKEQRPKLLAECMRVAEFRILLLFPYLSRANQLFESELEERLAMHGDRMLGLSEHRIFGLPDPQTIVSQFNSTEWDVNIHFVGPRGQLRASVAAQLRSPREERSAIADAFSLRALPTQKGGDDAYRVLLRAERRCEL
jgi:hypothetical protein